jgi:putative FmdB family regulatory protein
MPVYEYRCDRGHTFEVMQRMSDDPVAACEVCGAPVQRVFHPVAVHFKGSGFYTTDYGRKKAAASEAGAATDSDGKKDSSSSSSDSSSSDKGKSGAEKGAAGADKGKSGAGSGTSAG